jgi:flagellin
VNAAAKLDVTIRGATAELARYGAYINRLEIGSLNAREGATILNQSYDKIANTDYAKETIELTRNQIITQAATAILAQANQQGSSVIALLK